MERLGHTLAIAFACIGCSLGLIGAVNPSASVQHVPSAIMLPQFTVAARTPAYTLNSNCSMGGGAITFHLMVSNTGGIDSPAITKDQAGVMVSTTMQSGSSPGSLWSVAAALPAIPAHQSVPVDVTLMPLGSPSAMSGSHIFSAAVNVIGHVKTASTFGNSTTISVVVPSGFCPNWTAAARARTVSTLVAPTPTIAPEKTRGLTLANQSVMRQPPPILQAKIVPNSSKVATMRINAKRVALVALVAAPLNLVYTNDPAVCTAHAGLAGALICPSLISSQSALPLVWNWQPCTLTSCVSAVDGFHIYRVTNTWSGLNVIHLATRTLVDTQSDPTLTVRGISPYNKTDCYVVTAYKGSTESPDSNEWCGSSNLPMGTAWMEINPLASGSIDGGYGCNAYQGYPSSPNNLEGIVHFYGMTSYTIPPVECDGDLDYEATYKFDLSQLATISKVFFVARFVKERVPTGKDLLGDIMDTSTTYPCAITGLMNISDPSSLVPLQSDQYGVTADITRFFASSRVVTVGFSHTPYPNSTQDTCLTAFQDAHIDVTYFPQP
jgi:hypothetical protein